MWTFQSFTPFETVYLAWNLGFPVLLFSVFEHKLCCARKPASPIGHLTIIQNGGGKITVLECCCFLATMKDRVKDIQEKPK